MRKFRTKGNAILTLSVVCLLLVAVVVGLGVKIITSGTANKGGKPPVLGATAKATAPATSPYPNFKGIYEFGSGNSPSNADKSYLAGDYLGFYWSQLEPQKGQYSWSTIDQAMSPWTSHGKKVILRVSTSGWTSWYPPYSGNGTPAWIYKLGVPSVKEVDGSILPQAWNPIFQQNLGDFIRAFALRYDGNANVAYVEIGLGIGGEAKADSHNANANMVNLWHHIGYTDFLWWGALQQIMATYKSSFSKTPLAVMPDKTFIEKANGYNEALLLNYAVQHGMWLQDNSLVTGRTVPPQYLTVPHPEEQLAATTSTGDTLRGDIQSGLNLGGNYILVFRTDLKIPANLATLLWAASLVPAK